jgi:hypothetical protein
MTLSTREKRLLAVMGAVAIVVAISYSSSDSGTVKVVKASGSAELTKKRLEKLREAAATVPAKEAVLRQVTAELDRRQKGLLDGTTAPQAQAQLIQIVRRIGKSQNPPLEIRGSEFGQIRALGDAYGEVSVAVTFDAHIEQLVDLLADLTAQPEIVSSTELRVNASGANPKEKLLNVRLTVSGVVPRRLVPERKGPETF